MKLVPPLPPEPPPDPPGTDPGQGGTVVGLRQDLAGLMADLGRTAVQNPCLMAVADVPRPWEPQPNLICPHCDGSGSSKQTAIVDEWNPRGYVETEPCDECLGLGCHPRFAAAAEEVVEAKEQIGVVERALHTCLEVLSEVYVDLSDLANEMADQAPMSRLEIAERVAINAERIHSEALMKFHGDFV